MAGKLEMTAAQYLLEPAVQVDTLELSFVLISHNTNKCPMKLYPKGPLYPFFGTLCLASLDVKQTLLDYIFILVFHKQLIMSITFNDEKKSSSKEIVSMSTCRGTTNSREGRRMSQLTVH